eukprot:CAMPEP_0184427104 /NCGR_PEP_ID=MMETSP0738-20130409/173350_1 /TAXON_ID=385413 /ORGANISM="Thalassiosira miniscula, Strain CCMP1093" /LENGTH=98 /DNA_ID=CAMNT_0026790569 /DNA_START=76 /DNA_END=372 /DNA_ORIENTATION=-
MIRQHKPHRPRDMRHRFQQGFAFDQRLADKADLPVFQIAQPAVKQLGRGRGGRRGQIVHLCQLDGKPTAHGVACNAAAVDPSADHKEIDAVFCFKLAQ